MGRAIRIGLVAVGAIVIGSAMARGLPHHAAAPAAPPPSSGGGAGSLGNIVLLFILLMFLGGSALWLFHVRKLRELHMREAKLDGFVSVRKTELNDLWRCPECHALILVSDIDDHQEESACARMAPLIERIETLEGELAQLIQDIATRRVGTPEWAAEQIERAAEPPEDDEHLSATVPPEHSVMTGGYDSIEG